MHKRRDAGQEGCRRVEIEERRFAGNEGSRIGGIQYRKGGMLEM